jgi:hypothetical protein
MSHTDGPWTIGDVQWIMNQQTKMGYSYRPITAGSWELATVWEDDCDSEMTANVHLIAAAPDLLAACKLALTAGDQQYVQFILRDVIAKAEGVTMEGTNGKERSLD